MKIRINENETYQIEMPEEIDGQSLIGIVDRLSKILKIISKETDFSIATLDISKKQKKLSTAKQAVPRETYKELNEKIKNDKEFSRQLLTDYYANKVRYKEQIIKFASSATNSTFADVRRKILAAHHFGPNEIGLEKYPKKGESFKFLTDTTTQQNDTRPLI